MLACQPIGDFRSIHDTEGFGASSFFANKQCLRDLNKFAWITGSRPWSARTSLRVFCSPLTPIVDPRVNDDAAIVVALSFGHGVGEDVGARQGR